MNGRAAVPPVRDCGGAGRVHGRRLCPAPERAPWPSRARPCGRRPRCPTSTSTSTSAATCRAALAFTDPDGATVRLGDLFDGKRPVVLVLAYFRCPMLCDLVQQGVVSALRGSGLRPGRDVRAVTISIDPHDTRGNARLRQTGLADRARRRDAGAGRRVARAHRAGAPRSARSPTRSASATSSIRAARSTRIRRAPSCSRPTAASRATSTAPRSARSIVRLAAVEAAAGRIGGVVDRVLLTCFRYDPSARKYGVYVLGVMRGGSALVLLLFAVGDDRRCCVAIARAAAPGGDREPASCAACCSCRRRHPRSRARSTRSTTS